MAIPVDVFRHIEGPAQLSAVHGDDSHLGALGSVLERRNNPLAIWRKSGHTSIFLTDGNRLTTVYRHLEERRMTFVCRSIDEPFAVAGALRISIVVAKSHLPYFVSLRVGAPDISAGVVLRGV